MPLAARQFAHRLRELRESRLMLTQERFACAFIAEEKLTTGTYTLSLRDALPISPPRHRILTYARFFCTPRSTEGEPTLLPLEQFTSDENRAYEELLAELLRLRSALADESAA